LRREDVIRFLARQIKDALQQGNISRLAEPIKESLDKVGLKLMKLHEARDEAYLKSKRSSRRFGNVSVTNQGRKQKATLTLHLRGPGTMGRDSDASGN
jgi:outer membrane lipopolysaccharide assembly protein LptE/RlpB